jgi:hypothetical protein
MAHKRIYDVGGRWIGFVVDDDVFDKTGELMGHVVNGYEVYGLQGPNHESYGSRGSYLGRLTKDGRLLTEENSSNNSSKP